MSKPTVTIDNKTYELVTFGYGCTYCGLVKVENCKELTNNLCMKNMDDIFKLKKEKK